MGQVPMLRPSQPDRALTFAWLPGSPTPLPRSSSGSTKPTMTTTASLTITAGRSRPGNLPPARSLLGPSFATMLLREDPP